MNDEIFEAIRGWAGVFTWHTRHPLDERRFNEAVRLVYEAVGADINPNDFETALRRHMAEGASGLDGDISDEVVGKFVDRAMTILQFLDTEGTKSM